MGADMRGSDTGAVGAKKGIEVEGEEGEDEEEVAAGDVVG